ncbi:hypothetical protein SCA6_018500, partial [Theobroma cacao]
QFKLEAFKSSDYRNPVDSIRNAYSLFRMLVYDTEELEKEKSGYMSPEYAINGKFSVKSDVFGFGVLLLEIAWLLWNDNRALELLDPCLRHSCVESQVLRCIQVGLLCAQKLAENRPIMSDVAVMLGNEEVTLPEPKEPGFFTERRARDTDTSTDDRICCTKNSVTITMLEAR